MIFDLRSIQQNAYGTVDYPSLFLTSLSEEPICPIECYGLEATFRYNDVSEFKFTVPSVLQLGNDTVANPCYDEIRGMRLIDAGQYGIFILVDPEVSDDGITKVKECRAYSREYMLNYYTISGFDDETLMLYDPSGTANDTLMNIILEKTPGWSVGYVSTGVGSRYRTFSSSSESVYSFLMNTAQESYNCVFLFDTRNKKINIIDADAAVEQTDIFLDKQNVNKQINIKENSDGIVTCLYVYGDDDTSIRSVNVLGSDCIYNLNYFIDIGDIPKELGDKWKTWQESCRIYQKIFSDLYTKLYSDQCLYNTNYSKLVDLQGEYSSMEAVMDTYKTDTGGDHSTEIAELTVEMTAKKKEVDDQKAEVDAIYAKIESDTASMKEITTLCSFENNFTSDELKVLREYFKEDSISDSTYSTPTVSDTPTAFVSIDSLNIYSVEITKGDLWRFDDYVDLTEDEWAQLNLSYDKETELKNIVSEISSSYLGHKFYQINSGYCEMGNADDSFNLYGTIVNSTVSYSDTLNDDGSQDVVVNFTIDEPTYNGDEVSYTNALLIISGKMKNFNYSANPDSTDTDTMSFELTGGILTLTADSSINQRQNVIQDLYDYGVSCLDKLSWPEYEFDIDCTNFLFAPEYKHFHDNFGLGKAAYVEIDEHMYLSPIMTGVTIKFDDWPEISLEMSNTFRSNKAEFKLADVLGKTAQTAASLDASKFNYSAFVNSNIKNDVEELINGVLDIAKKNVINSVNQDILMDGRGIHLRKLNPSSGTYDPEEVRLTSNRIVFTNDSWNTASLAIGKLETPDGATTMGIVGQSIIGEILIGNKLLIEASGPDLFTGKDKVTHFRVDSQGASLANASFAIQGTSGNQILLDPNYGILAGNGELFTMGESKLKYDFIDDEGNIKYDQTLLNDYGIKMPSGGAFFFDVATGSLAFKGDIYANNGYFKGTVNADSGYFKGEINVNDNFIVDKDGNMTAKNADVSGKIKATTLDCTNAKVSGLEVGKNITMASNAVISWSNLPIGVASTSDIPSDTEITTITQNSISTGTLKLAGNIYRTTSTYDNSNFLIGINNIGTNKDNRLQIGSPNASADYTGSSYYSNGNIYFVTNGTSVEDRALLIDSSNFVTIDSLKSDIKDSASDTATHGLVVAGSDGKLHRSTTTIGSLKDGSLKVTAVFG